MNIFRFFGDMSHLASFIFLLYRLRQSKSAAGVSLKTLELYLIVFVCRYLDLFTSFYSYYNTAMKILYIAVSAAVVYYIRAKEPWRTSYDGVRDNFPHLKFLVLPCACLALVINDGYIKFGIGSYIMEILWTFSIYLEAVAIYPQLQVLQRMKEVENITSHYVFALGAYRLLYIANWIYRWFTTPYYRAYIAWVSGVVQTALYVDFFYYYAKSKWAGMDSVPLPT